MSQNRKRSEDMPTRSSNMEPAEGSRENVMDSGDDLGTSSDRAMFDERAQQSDRTSSDRGKSSARGTGSDEQRGHKGGGITNRPLDQEQSEQDRVPDRGRSRSER